MRVCVRVCVWTHFACMYLFLGLNQFMPFVFYNYSVTQIVSGMRSRSACWVKDWFRLREETMISFQIGKSMLINALKNFLGFPNSSVGRESACNAGDPDPIPGSGRSTGEGIGYPLQYSWASLVVQLVKNPPAMWETWVQSLGCETIYHRLGLEPLCGDANRAKTLLGT